QVEDGTGEHPFRKSLETLRIGDQFASDLRKVTLKDILDFAEETGDTFYAHTDEEAAMANPFFPRRVAHGYLLVSWAAGLFVEPAPGPVLANYGLENLSFITPVTYDDSIRVTLTAKQITPRVTDEYGEVRWDAVLHNQDDEIVATYDVLTLVTKTWPQTNDSYPLCIANSNQYGRDSLFELPRPYYLSHSVMAASLRLQW